jgi:type VI secretion system secreted protein VgrG
VHRLEREVRDEPGEVELREYDFERPGLALTSKAGDRKGPQVYESVNGKCDGGSMSEGLLQADKINIVVGGKLLLSLEKSGTLQFFGKTLTVDGKQLKLKGGKIKKDRVPATGSTRG